MRTFWIDFQTSGKSLTIRVGKENENTEFMSRCWDLNPAKSWPPTHVAFSAWDTKVDFEICIPIGVQSGQWYSKDDDKNEH